MKLLDNEVQQFFQQIKLSKTKREISLSFLNQILLNTAQYIPWQNITMINSGLGVIPTNQVIKNNLLLGYGGICLDINRFFFHFLKKLGFNVQRILCGRENKDKRHLALIVYFDDVPFFVDPGDAQPYYQALNINSTNILYRGIYDYRIERKHNVYHLMRRDKDKWKPLYIFDLSVCTTNEIEIITQKYYADVFFSHFWKRLYFAYYPNKELKAIIGDTILIDKKGAINKIKRSTENKGDLSLNKYFQQEILSKFQFTSSIDKLNKINLKERFGLYISNKELTVFLNDIGINNIEQNLSFIQTLIESVLANLPFQNYKMIERGFGHIPTEKNIKADMLSLNGGTCATMNIFIGAILYRIGFDVALINGSMSVINDHIALILNYNNERYIIDVGDGQPYFQPFPINKEIVVKHPFRTYRTVITDNKLRIDFLINEEWKKDVEYVTFPRTYSQVHRTIKQHYTKADYGPFWKGVRFAIYPNKEIIAFRDNTIIVQKNNLIIRENIKDFDALILLIDQYIPQFKDQLLSCFKTLKVL